MLRLRCWCCSVSENPRLSVVSKEGTGAEPVSGGQGLRGMRERIAGVGGTLHVGATDDGWRVEAKVPA